MPQPIDTTLLPISSADLSLAVKQCRTQTDFYLIVNRARANNLKRDIVEDLRTLKLQNPQEPVILSAYCLALRLGGGGDYTHEYDSDLKQAMKLGPNLWLPLVTEGELLMSSPDQAKGIKMLQKAVDLDPSISITHYYLADGYMFPSPFHSSSLAEQEWNKAVQLSPVLSWAQFFRVTLYMWQPSKVSRSKAYAAKQQYLAELPPGYVQDGGDAATAKQVFAALDKYAAKMPP